MGKTGNKFITRYGDHKQSVNNPIYKNKTELSKKVWDLKSKNIPFTIDWEHKKSAPSYKPGDRFCCLCVTEIQEIINLKKKGNINLLNTRNELYKKCRHKEKFKLSKFKPI